MPSERVERRLAAILAADVVGYSRLTGLDEEGTHVRLKEHLRVLVEPKISEHRGKVVKNTGDGLLAEFGSVVDAVRCAVEVQHGMAERNADLPPDTRIEFRIGINVGDIIVDGGDVFGDGVNVAVRLEGIAEPGGICVSARVQEFAQAQLHLAFEDTGEHQLKNIAKPVRAYRVRHAVTTRPTVSDKQVGPATPYLSIVVLPFANLSNDPEQEYFADGLTRDLTTDLSRRTDSFVIASGTAFTYKNKAVDARRIGQELRVRYVVEGSVRRSKNRIRVGVQVIDAESGGHLWADRFDRDLADLLEMQDEIIGRIAVALHYKLTDLGRRRAERSNSTDAVDLEFRGYAALYKASSKTDLTESRSFFQQALKIDNRSVSAWAGLAVTHAEEVISRWSDAPEEQVRAAEEAATKAMVSNPTSADAHIARATVLFAQAKIEAALAEYANAVELDRNWAVAYARMGLLNALLGRPEETVHLVERAIRLSPRDNSLAQWYLYIGIACFMMDQLEPAIIWLRRSTDLNSEVAACHYTLASACSLAGRQEEAAAALSELKRLYPDITIDKLRASPYGNHPAYLHWRERLFEGLRLAGLPE